MVDNWESRSKARYRGIHRVQKVLADASTAVY